MEDLAAALFGRKVEDVWQDREIRFDAAATSLRCRKGENILETFVSITAVFRYTGEYVLGDGPPVCSDLPNLDCRTL